MRTDPIVEEVRKTGQDYIDYFKGDWKALVADLNRRAEAAGRRLVSRPPVRVEPPANKKIGRPASNFPPIS